MKQKLALISVILHRPELLLLDEPTNGVDPVARVLFWELIREIKNYWSIPVLITTHHLEEVEYCDRVIFMVSGKKVLNSKVEELKDKYPGLSYEDIFVKVLTERV